MSIFEEIHDLTGGEERVVTITVSLLVDLISNSAHLSYYAKRELTKQIKKQIKIQNETKTEQKGESTMIIHSSEFSGAPKKVVEEVCKKYNTSVKFDDEHAVINADEMTCNQIKDVCKRKMNEQKKEQIEEETPQKDVDDFADENLTDEEL